MANWELRPSCRNSHMKGYYISGFAIAESLSSATYTPGSGTKPGSMPVSVNNKRTPPCPPLHIVYG